MRPIEAALSLDAGATCLDRDQLVRKIARWLRRDQIEATLTIEVRGDTQHPERVTFAIDRGPGGRAERTLADASLDCEQLHSAVALSIALAIDASVGGAPAGDAAAELPSDEQLLAPTEKPRPPEPPYLRIALAVLGHATSGVLTDPSWGGSARLEVGPFRFLDLRLAAFGTTLGAQVLRGASEEGTFRISLLAGRLDACAVHAGEGDLRAAACLGGVAGVLRTQGQGYESTATEQRLWTAVVGSIEAQVRLAGPLSLGASVDLLVPLARHRIQALDAQGQLAGERVLTPVGVLIGAGPVMRFL